MTTRAPAAARRLRPVLRLLGIEIHFDPSVLLIFALVVWSLALGTLPAWHPEWGAVLLWSVALAAGLVLFASLLAHELAHAVVARLEGIAVPRITLFLFGGVAQLADEPRTPGAELRIAVAGPALSLLLGLLLSGLGMALLPQGFTAQLVEAPDEAMATLGPTATLLLWVGPVNLVLALFNLLPGFPLDGGRVLRAILWKVTGDAAAATATAAKGGALLGWMLIAGGLLQVMRGDLGGLWLVLVGWFLLGSARRSASGFELRRRLEGLHVGDLMRTRFEQVEADAPLDRFVDEVLLRGDQEAWPVTRAGHAVGLLTLAQVVAVPEGERAQHTVGEVMAPLRDPVGPGLDGRRALEAMAHQDPLVVVDGEEVIGLLDAGDIPRWLSLHPQATAA